MVNFGDPQLSESASRDHISNEELYERGRILGLVNEQARAVAGALASHEDAQWFVGVVYKQQRDKGLHGFIEYLLGKKMKLIWLEMKKPYYLGIDGRIYRQKVGPNGKLHYVDAELRTRRADGLKQVRHALRQLHHTLSH